MGDENMYFEECNNCLRGINNLCSAFSAKPTLKGKQIEKCWAYTDDKNVFEAQEAERQQYISSRIGR